METREFIASLVDSLAWPVAVVVAVLVLRPLLTSMLASARLTKLRAGGFEAEWEHGSEQVRESVVAVTPADAATITSSSVDDSVFAALADVAKTSPNAAIVEAFRLVEAELVRLLDEAGVEIHAMGVSARQLAKVAFDNKLITEGSLSSIEGLAVMRNLAAHGHGQQSSTARAVEFIQLADAVLYALRVRPSPDH